MYQSLNFTEAATDPVNTSDGSSVVYAVFTTPSSAVRMSAVCAFRMDDIRRLFDTGDFKVQKTVNSLWSAHRSYELPKPRPGSVLCYLSTFLYCSALIVTFQCVPESTRLPEQVTAFVTRNPLMYDTVGNMLSRPLVVEGADRAELTQIAVAPQIKAVSGRRHDVLFVGTADGKVLKLIDTGAGRATMIEAIRVFDRMEPIVNLLTSDNQLIVVSRDQVAGIPLYYCGEQRSCSACVRLQDPYCAWDLSSAHCVGRSDGYETRSFPSSLIKLIVPLAVTGRVAISSKTSPSANRSNVRKVSFASIFVHLSYDSRAALVYSTF